MSLVTLESCLHMRGCHPLSNASINYYDSFLPMVRVRLDDRGSLIGLLHSMSGNRSESRFSCNSPTNIARRPPGSTNPAATGRIDSKRSTARSVTACPLGHGMPLPSPQRLQRSLSSSLRTTSRKNVAFFWFDSIRVRSILRSPYLDGEAGEASAGADVYHMRRGFGGVHPRHWRRGKCAGQQKWIRQSGGLRFLPARALQ